MKAELRTTTPEHIRFFHVGEKVPPSPAVTQPTQGQQRRDSDILNECGYVSGKFGSRSYRGFD